MVDKSAIETAIRQLLVAVGENPDREGLVDTPGRVARYWAEFIDYDPGSLGTTFASVGTDQMVVVTGMRVWSMCEHHLLPFWCDVSVGYLTGDKVLGLSKFARIAHDAAHQLNLQEQLVEQIAQGVVKATGSENVAVIASGEHLCMTARGIQTPHRMISSSMKGRFRDKPEVRAEFLGLVNG